MRRRLLGVVTILGIVAASFTAGYAVQTHMDNALAALQNARNELQVAEHNKGGHRVNAIRPVDQAMAEVRAGIAAGR